MLMPLMVFGLLDFRASPFAAERPPFQPGLFSFGANLCDGPTRFLQVPSQRPRSRVATLEPGSAELCTELARKPATTLSRLPAVCGEYDGR